MSIPILKIFTLFFLCFSDIAKYCPALLADPTHIPRCISKNTRLRDPQRKIQSANLFQIRQPTMTDIRVGKNKSTNKTVSRASSVEYRFAREGQQTSQTNFRCCGLPTVKHARLRQNLQASLRLRQRSIPLDADGNSRL